MRTAIGMHGFFSRRRLPVIRQTELAECGLACLAMVANYYGYNATLSRLRLTHSVSAKGMTLRTMISIAAKLGLGARPLRSSLSSLQRIRTPCILHWEFSHFVVLKNTHKGYFVIHDPAVGERRLAASEVSTRFTGIALELAPAVGFRPLVSGPTMRLTDLWSKSTGLAASIAQVLLLSAAIQVLLLAAPFYVQLVVDSVVTTSDSDLLLVIATGFALLVVLGVAASVLRSFVVLYLGSTLNYQMVANLFRHLLGLPIDWFERRHVGDIASRFASTRPVRELVSEGAVAAILDGCMASFALIIMLVYSPILAGIALTATTFYCILRVVLYRPLRQRSEQQIAAAAREQSTFIESVRAIQSIKSFCHEPVRVATWQNQYADVINQDVRLGWLTIIFTSSNQLLFGLENVLVVYVGAGEVIAGHLTIGMLLAFLAYKQHFASKSAMLVERLIEYRLLSLHLGRISDISLAELEPGAWTTMSCAEVPAIRSAALRNVFYRYADDEPWILEDGTLEVRRGELVVIIGPSGSGKTTILKLLLGLLKPCLGELHCNNQRLPDTAQQSYRSKTGTLLQGDSLLTGTIAENISFFDADANTEHIKRCAAASAIHTDIMALPMQYSSLVGDMGDSFSAGQRQRLLLARALYRNPELLLLDESTANLDIATEKKVIDSLKSLRCARLCVAHSDAMIAAADRIVLLRERTLIEISPQQWQASYRRSGTARGAGEDLPDLDPVLRCEI